MCVLHQIAGIRGGCKNDWKQFKFVHILWTCQFHKKEKKKIERRTKWFLLVTVNNRTRAAVKDDIDNAFDDSHTHFHDSQHANLFRIRDYQNHARICNISE